MNRGPVGDNHHSALDEVLASDPALSAPYNKIVKENGFHNNDCNPKVLYNLPALAPSDAHTFLQPIFVLPLSPPLSQSSVQRHTKLLVLNKIWLPPKLNAGFDPTGIPPEWLLPDKELRMNKIMRENSNFKGMSTFPAISPKAQVPTDLECFAQIGLAAMQWISHSCTARLRNEEMHQPLAFKERLFVLTPSCGPGNLRSVGGHA